MTIPLQGWSYMEKGITKLKRILEGDPDEESFDAEFYMMLYTCACVLSPANSFSCRQAPLPLVAVGCH